jgi:hypothetical protein
VAEMLQNSPKRICDFKIFSGVIPPDPTKKGRKEEGGKARRGEEGRQGEWREGGRKGEVGKGMGEGMGGEGGEGKFRTPHFLKQSYALAQAPKFPSMSFPDGTGLPAIGWEAGTRPPRIFWLEPRLVLRVQFMRKAEKLTQLLQPCFTALYS